MFRQAKQKGAAVKKNKQEQPLKHFALLKIMSLAYLPADQIPSTYARLKKDIKEEFSSYFDRFFSYFETTWLPTAQVWSCYRRKHNSNNFLESYHKSLKKIIGVKPHVGFFFSKSIL